METAHYDSTKDAGVIAAKKANAAMIATAHRIRTAIADAVASSSTEALFHAIEELAELKGEMRRWDQGHLALCGSVLVPKRDGKHFFCARHPDKLRDEPGRCPVEHGPAFITRSADERAAAFGGFTSGMFITASRALLDIELYAHVRHATHRSAASWAELVKRIVHRILKVEHESALLRPELEATFCELVQYGCQDVNLHALVGKLTPYAREPIF